jgi:hypothetical protein
MVKAAVDRVKGLQAKVEAVTALKAVAVADFVRLPTGVQSALSTPDLNSFQTPEEAKGKFGLGTQVFYDGKPHWIIGQFTAK